MFALSTSWNAWRHSSAAALVNEARDLGFSSLELGFSFPLHLFEGMKREVEAGRIYVVSLHDYCPRLNLGSSSRAARRECYLSSGNREDRKSAVSAAIRTLRSAREVNASAVVIHSGKVPLWTSSRRIFGLMELREDISHPPLRRKLEKAVARREKRKSAYLNRTLESLREIAENAAAVGIKIGIETRYYIEEIPSFDEIGVILSSIDSPWLGYWHDVGHAQVKENLGFERQEDYLRRYGGRLIGAHIHDASRLRDHRAPLTGEIDFSRLRSLLADEDLLRVIEVHPFVTADEVKEGLAFLTSLTKGA